MQKSRYWAYFALLLLLLLFVFALGNSLRYLLIAFALTYICYPFVKHLEKRGIKRLYAVLGVMLCLLLACAVILCLLLPPLMIQCAHFFSAFPHTVAALIPKIESELTRWGYDLPLDRGTLTNYAREFSKQFSMSSLGLATEVFTSFVHNLWGHFVSLLQLFLIPVFFYFITEHFEKIHRECFSWIPEIRRSSVQSLLDDINRVLTAYVRGNLIVICCLALLYSIGLYFISLPFAILIGIATAILSLIPFAGVTIGFVLSFSLALADGMGSQTLLLIAVLFLVIHVIESYMLVPKIIGDKVGLGAFWILVAMIVGSRFGGVWGLIIAVPLFAILKILLGRLKPYIAGRNP